MNLVKSAVLAAVLALSALIAGCGGGSDDTPEGPAILYVQSLYEGDGTKALEQVMLPDNMSSEQKQLADNKLNALAESAKRGADRRGGIDKIEVVKVELNSDGSEAVVKLKTIFNNGSSDPHELNTIKDADGKWKVK